MEKKEIRDFHDDKATDTAGVSRRDFLKTSAAGAGAAAAAGAVGTSFAEETTGGDVEPIRVPNDFAASVDLPPKPASFDGRGMTGADVFARTCVGEDLAAMFCCPGNYDVINALAVAGIPCFGGRTEGSMCAAADGFSRVTGEVVAASGTEGPGFTNMIMNIAAASAARTPLLVLASNMTLAGEDRERQIQHVYQQCTTEGMKKYGKRLIAPDRVHEYAAQAFRQLKAGVPGPVHLDFPAEVARARFTDSSQLTDFYDSDRYRATSRPHPSPKDVEAAVALIDRAERPIMVAGQGVFQRGAWEPLIAAAEKHDLVVVESGPVRGHFGDDHRLSAGTAWDALMSADLVVFVGQYCMPSPEEYRFNPDVKAIRVHPVQEDLGRNWPLDLGIVGDELAFLEALSDMLPKKSRPAWTAEVAAAREKFERELTELYELGLKYSRQTDHLHPAVIMQEISNLGGSGLVDPRQTTAVAGGLTIGLYAARWSKALRPGQMVAGPYQYGAIGPDIGMAVGIGAAVQRGVGPQAPYQGAPVLCITSDAATAYSLFELDTAIKYKIPIVVVIYNNNSWGNWPIAARSPQAMHMYLFQENLRYDKLAEGLGARGEYVRTPEQFREALGRSFQVAAKEKVSSLINCQALKEFSSSRDYPPGIVRNVEPGVATFMH